MFEWFWTTNKVILNHIVLHHYIHYKCTYKWPIFRNKLKWTQKDRMRWLPRWEAVFSATISSMATVMAIPNGSLSSTYLKHHLKQRNHSPVELEKMTEQMFSYRNPFQSNIRWPKQSLHCHRNFEHQQSLSLSNNSGNPRPVFAHLFPTP